MADEFVKADTAVRHDAGHIRTGKGVCQEDQRHGDHGPADRAAGRFKYQHDTQDTYHDVRFGVHAGPEHQLVVLKENIHRREHAEYRKYQIHRVHGFSRPARPPRIQKVNQRHTEA